MIDHPRHTAWTLLKARLILQVRKRWNVFDMCDRSGRSVRENSQDTASWTLLGAIAFYETASTCGAREACEIAIVNRVGWARWRAIHPLASLNHFAAAHDHFGVMNLLEDAIAIVVPDVLPWDGDSRELRKHPAWNSIASRLAALEAGNA